MQYYYMRRLFSILLIWSATNIKTETIKRFHFLDEQIHEIFITTENRIQITTCTEPINANRFSLKSFLFCFFYFIFDLIFQSRHFLLLYEFRLCHNELSEWISKKTNQMIAHRTIAIVTVSCNISFTFNMFGWFGCLVRNRCFS